MLAKEQLKHNLGENVKRAREEKGITLTELARQCVISKSYLSQIEKGNYIRPSYEVVYKLGQALGIDTEELYFGVQ